MTGGRDRLRDLGVHSLWLRWGGAREPRLRRRPIGLRRFLAAGLLATAAAVALPVLAPGPPDLVPVVVAARDVGAGHRLTTDDLRVTRWVASMRTGATMSDVSAALGRVTAGPLDRGGVVSESSLLGPGLLTGQPADLVAVPVRLAEPAAASLVRRGDRVDVIAAASGSSVVTAAVVLARLPSPGDSADGWGGLGSSAGAGSGAGSGGSGGGAVVVLGVRSEEASELARAEASGALAVAVRPT